jgi:hypothetical protein
MADSLVTPSQEFFISSHRARKVWEVSSSAHLTPLEVTYIMRSLVGILKVFSERSLHVKPGLDGIFCQVIDPLPRYAGEHQGQIADNNIG